MLTFSTILKSFILPPGLLILLLLIGLCCFRWRKLSFVVIAFTTLSLYLLSLMPVALLLARPLQHYPALTDDAISKTKAQAIIVLSGGRYKNPPEYANEDRASAYELMRLQYAAYLYRKTHLPILVTGGFGFEKNLSEAQIMANVLREDFKVPVRWIENKSDNTWENAKYSIAILQQARITRAFLVTDAIHIPRSMLSFKHFGFTVIAAPTHFFTADGCGRKFALLPNPEALRMSIFCLYEYFGLVLYTIL